MNADSRIEIKSEAWPSIPKAELIKRILGSALNSVNPIDIVNNAIELEKDNLIIANKIIRLKSEQKIYLIGFGKASQLMAVGLKKKLGGKLNTGLIISKHLDPQLEKKLNPQIHTLVSGHPIPTEASINNTIKLIDFIRNTENDCLLICLISGGGSALLTKPAQNITLENLKVITSTLLKSGASITEMNTIRKHVDEIKGGGLARLTYPRQMITLIISDVVGDPLSMIASGPTTFDETTFLDALNIINKYDLNEITDKHIIDYLNKGKTGIKPETLKAEDPILNNVNNFIIANNHIASLSAQNKARNLGITCEIITNQLCGSAVEAGRYLGEFAQKIFQGQSPITRPACLIAGGETTVIVKGSGLGGRNQEVALSAAISISGIPNSYIVTLATDGEDGPTDAAGAIVSGETIRQAQSIGLNANEFLLRNDSFHFFEKTGLLIKTGPTGTNVNDLNFVFMF